MTSYYVRFSIVILGSAILFASPAYAAEPAMAEADFVKMDTNKDGKISADEHAAAAKTMFDTMDANKNGKVTAAEMDAAHERITGKKVTTSDLSAAEKIKVIDADGDGILTAEEHAAGSRAMFAKMDTDKDGVLSKAEFAAGHASMLKKPAR
jgi:Ca2+-binding EF-hand superfamily protein